MTHVAHVLHELMPSGAETMLAVAGPLWASHGVRCSVVATAPTIGPYASQLEAAGYRVHHMPMSGSLNFYRDWRQWLAREQVDCVHVHKETAADYLMLASLGGGRRIVCTHHSVFPFAGRVRWRRALGRRLCTWLGVRYVSIGASVSRNEQERFFNRTQVIYNWFDGSRFRPATPAERQVQRERLSLPADAPVILSVGNCMPVKNHDGLLQALARVQHLPWVYLHAGREDAQQSERMLAQTLGLADRVRFLGPRADVPDLLAACDGYVMPSRHEGLPISALEALVSGLPCLFTDVPGLSDLRPYAPQVQWATGPSSEALASALAQWLPVLGVAARQACQQQAANVAQVFSCEAGVAAYVAAYRGLQEPARLAHESV